MTPSEPQSEPPKLDRCRYPFSLAELLVLVAIIAFVLALFLPALIAAREAGRRATCIGKLKQMGLGFQN